MSWRDTIAPVEEAPEPEVSPQTEQGWRATIEPVQVEAEVSEPDAEVREGWRSTVSEIPEVPLEQHPFVLNTLADPKLSGDQRRDIVETYGQTYSAKIGAETDAIDSFTINFRNSWDNYNTLGAELRRKRLGSDSILGGDWERVENLNTSAEQIEAELQRRKVGGEREKKGVIGAIVNVYGQLYGAEGAKEDAYQSMSEDALSKLLVDKQTSAETLREELQGQRYSELLNEARKQAEYSALDSEGFLQNVAAASGTLGGAAVDPVNAVPLAKAGQTANLATRVGVNVAQGAAVNAAINPALQASAVDANAQEGFEWNQFFADAGLGGVAAGGFSLLGEAGSALLKRFKVEPSLVEGKNVGEALETIQKETGQSGEEISKALEVDKIQKPAEELVETTAKSSAIPEGQKQRGFSERLKGDENFDGDEIATNPNEYYEPQPNDVGEKIVEQMDDAQLAKAFSDPQTSAPSGENYSTLAGIEQLRRAVARGEDTTPIREALSKRGTSLGQLVQQFSRWKTTTPEGLLTVIENEVNRAGRKLPDMARKRGTTLAKRQLETVEGLRQAEARHLDEFTDETAKVYEQARKTAAKAAREFDGFARDMTPQGLWKTLGTTVKGNLLTSESLIVNVFGNALYYPVRKTKGVVATGLDALWAIGSKQRTHAEGRAKTRGELKGALSGLAEGIDAMVHGGTMDDYLKADVQRGFRPVRAMVQAFSPSEKGILPVKTNGKVAMTDRGRALVEGLIGAPPETMFRLLQLGDKPFKSSAYRGAVEELGSIKGLKGVDREKFIFHPDEASRALAVERGNAAVFMKDGKAGKIFQVIDEIVGSVPVIGKPAQFLSTLIMPYRQFPINFITEAVDYAFPVVSASKGIYHATRGAQRDSTESFAKAVIGGTMYAGAAYLYENGLITPEISSKDRKLKQLGYSFRQPPGTLNVSGLKRMLSGGSPKFQESDIVMNYEKTGIPGIVMHLESQLQWNGQKKAAEGKIVPSAQWWERAIPIREPAESLNYMVEATPLMGAGSFLTALQDWDRYGATWLRDMSNAVSSIAVPNAATAAFKAKYEHIPELKGQTVAETFRNVWNYKTLNLGGDFPTKVGLFGEKVERTPANVNPWVYHLLNPVDLRKSQSKPAYNLIEGLYRKTGDTSVIPGHPSRTFKDSRTGQTYKLDPKNYELLQQHVGQRRLMYLKDSLMKEKGVADWSNEEVVAYMKKVNSSGRRLGVAEFINDPRLDLSKAEKVGEAEGYSGGLVRDLIESVGSRRL